MRAWGLACCLLLSCGRGAAPPIGSTCAACRLSVSEPRFAGQRLQRGGKAEFFDDLGCLARSLRERPLERGGAAYVADFRTGPWLPAPAASFVRARGTHTPAGSGQVAFADRAEAEKVAALRGGRVLAWPELVGLPARAAAPPAPGH